MRANWTRSVEYGYPAAQRDLERAEALQPAKADLRYAQAMLARDQGNLPEAFRRYREALQLDPQNGDYTNAFAVGLCLPRGEYVEADQLFWRAMAIQGPGVATPFTNLIHLRSLWRGPEAALRLLDRMPATQAGLDDRRVSLLVSLGRLDEARAVADQLASMASPAGSVALLASQNQRPEPALLLALGREEQARQRAKEILADTTRELARGNRAPLVRTAFIRAEILLGHRDSALAALREWREEAQRMPSDYRRLSEFTSTASALYALLGQADEAVALMRELKANGYIARYGLRHNPDFAPIRSDPRFQEIERQYEAWRKTLPDPVDL
jgi:tetratricopeptide (TPR) repeat protein